MKYEETDECDGCETIAGVVRHLEQHDVFAPAHVAEMVSNRIANDASSHDDNCAQEHACVCQSAQSRTWTAKTGSGCMSPLALFGNVAIAHAALADVFVCVSHKFAN